MGHGANAGDANHAQDGRVAEHGSGGPDVVAEAGAVPGCALDVAEGKQDDQGGQSCRDDEEIGESPPLEAVPFEAPEGEAAEDEAHDKGGKAVAGGAAHAMDREGRGAFIGVGDGEGAEGGGVPD